MNKKIAIISLISAMIFISSTFVHAKKITYEPINELIEMDNVWFENNPDSQPIWLTQDELKHIDDIGKGFIETIPPSGPVRMPAEFEPMQGVLIRSPFGISYQIIAEMSEDIEVVTIVSSQSEKNNVLSQYQSNGVNIDNCDFLIAPSDSYWTRDYGPWFIFNGDDEQGIVDMIYNRPRPNDDLIPTRYGNWRDIPIYNMPLEHAGGNYMTDGQGIAVSTDLVWSENSGFSHSEIDQIMNDYCGIETYLVVPDALGAYIKHIDCWAKFLSPDTIMIIKSSTSHSRYQDFEEAAEFFENQTSCYGTPFNVVRVYTHLNEPYINSLILNNKVLMPITGSQWDDDAIDSYQSALPGYEVLGFYGSWQSTDALHCRTKGIVDRNMLYIQHTPVHGQKQGHEGYDIKANITAFSNEPLITDQTGVFWKIDQGSWNFVEMQHLVNNQYNATIPIQQDDVTIQYYIHAKDMSGRSENHPYIGEPMAYSFEWNLTNEAPTSPDIKGPVEGDINQLLEFSFDSTDPEADEIYYQINWGDGNSEDWIGPYESGEEVFLTHTFTSAANFSILAKSKDIFNYESDWSNFNINIPREKSSQLKFSNMISIFSDILRFLRLALMQF